MRRDGRRPWCEWRRCEWEGAARQLGATIADQASASAHHGAHSAHHGATIACQASASAMVGAASATLEAAAAA